jgi:hypothetical protein
MKVKVETPIAHIVIPAAAIGRRHTRRINNQSKKMQKTTPPAVSRRGVVAGDSHNKKKFSRSPGERIGSFPFTLKHIPVIRSPVKETINRKELQNVIGLFVKGK